METGHDFDSARFCPLGLPPPSNCRLHRQVTRKRHDMDTEFSSTGLTLTTPRSLIFVWGAWRQLSRTYFLFAALFGVTWGLAGGLTQWTSRPHTALWHVVASTCYEKLSIALALLLAIAVADRVTATRGHRWVPYAIAAVVGTVLGTLLPRATYPVYIACDCGPRDFWFDYSLGVIAQMSLAGIVVFGYAYRRRGMQRLAALREMQLERAQVARQTFESRLQAMQARVEPRFLFNTLAQIEFLYESDPKVADRVLDGLIVYLRAALPQLRETTSTLAKEIELARAYLDIMKVRLGDRFAFDIAVPTDAQHVRAPPMVLLPLIDHALQSRSESSKIGGTLRIDTVVDRGKLRLTLADSGGGFVRGTPDDEGIKSILERLQQVYGLHARLELNGMQPHGTSALMEIPYERIESGTS